MVAMRSCHSRFDERDKPKMGTLEERSSMLLSNEMLDRVFLVNRVSCAFRELDRTRLVKDQSRIWEESI